MALEKAAGSADVLAGHRERHEKGAAVVLRMTGAVRAVVLVWSEVTDTGGREIVCGLGTGENARQFLPWLIEFARANRAGSVRIHCRRAGLARLCEKAGFYRVGLDDEGLHIVRWSDGRK